MIAFCVVRSWRSKSERFLDVVCITSESGEATGSVRLYACESELVLDTELDSQDELGAGVITTMDSATCAAWNFRSLRVVGSGMLPNTNELLTNCSTHLSQQIRCEVNLLIEDASDSPVSALGRLRAERIDRLFGSVPVETRPSPNSFRTGSLLIFNRTSIDPESYGIVKLCSNVGKNRFSVLIKTVHSGDLASDEVLSVEWTAMLASLPVSDEGEAIDGFETLGRTVPIVEIQKL